MDWSWSAKVKKQLIATTSFISKRKVFFIAILIAAIFQLWFFHTFAFVATPDAQGYGSDSQSILSGNWFQNFTNYRLPLYPLFLALMRFIFGGLVGREYFFIIALLNIVMFIYIYKTTETLYKSRTISVITTLVWAMHPGYFVSHSVFLGPSNITPLFFFFTVYHFIKFFEQKGSLAHFGYALAGGALYSVTRAEGLLILLVLSIAALLYMIFTTWNKGFKAVRKKAVVYILVILIGFSPLLIWSFHNYLKIDNFSPTSYGGLSLFWAVVCQGGFIDYSDATTAKAMELYHNKIDPNYKNVYHHANPWQLHNMLIQQRNSELDTDRIMKHIAKTALMNNLLGFSKYYLNKFPLALRNALTFCRGSEPGSYIKMTNALTNKGAALAIVLDARQHPLINKMQPSVDIENIFGRVDTSNILGSFYARYIIDNLNRITDANQWIYFILFFSGAAVSLLLTDRKFLLVMFLTLLLLIFSAIVFYAEEFIFRFYVPFAPLLSSLIISASVFSIYQICSNTKKDSKTPWLSVKNLIATSYILLVVVSLFTQF